MRIATLALLTTVLVSPALAADLDYGVLRGYDDDYPAPAPIIDWSGFYVGGHGGYSSASMGFTNVFSKPYSQYFRARDIETEFGISSLLSFASQRVHGITYGAFASYNIQLDDAVFGIEVDYTSFSKSGMSYSEISRFVTTKNNMFETVNLRGFSRTELEDFGTIRGRAGYAFGSFLPFVTAGLAIGRATILDQPEVQNYGYDATAAAAYQTNPKAGAPVTHHGYANGNTAFDPSAPQDPQKSIPDGFYQIPAKPKSKAMAGVALGAGLEYAITPNFLLRGEYQYVLFDDFDGHKINVNTVRGGAAIKF
ncbi:outer membrane protein [Methylorubrum extorquens]|uniref:outer membrane protein n=1 Tax=Methylorubrum extorquens TaxID=408 RepID=UPI0009B67364|nr:outer membrane beta-barrel protein [Methylorubrum extorquens]WIU39777.1 outer membrane beta-barrel protein [Methylorubrum extorquens]